MKPFLLSTFLLLNLVARGQFNCQQTKASWSAAAPSSLQQTVPINYNSRSDTADLVHLKLSVDTRDFANKQLSAAANYQIGVKLAFTSLRFDLLGFTVDSVVSASGPLNFVQNGEHLRVLSAGQPGQILNWTIYYRGTTTKDASGWGGMHHDGAYHYNLGVGFAANPHVYGRSLFPCFDNFVEKCMLKEMNITTSAGLVGVSNGLLNGVDTLSSGDLVWHWTGTAPLPSYLVSLAVSDYHVQSWTHAGKPFALYGRSTDTANMSAGFVHLNAIYDAFVQEFGPYVFEKVGYAMTITGAMEHAGMIHLPRTLANAQLQGEDIIAHELAHMWFGNAVTTARAEDMWFNEGFAEFGSHFYEEKVYGRPRYVTTVQNNQAFVLKEAHVRDGGHLALSGVNQDQTYGTHTYQKGAMVAHNLREYLGDSLFSFGIKQALAANMFGNYDADGFKLALESATGVDLDDFWNEWIYSPGYYAVAPTYMTGLGTTALHPLSYAVDSSTAAVSKSIPIWIYKHSPSLGYLGKEFWGYSGDLNASGTASTFYQDTNLPSDAWLSVNDSAESLGAVVYDAFRWEDLTGPTVLPRTGVTVRPIANPDSMNGVFYVHHYYDNYLIHEIGLDTRTTKNHCWSVNYQGQHDQNGALTLPFEIDFPYNANVAQGGLDSDLSAVPTDSLVLTKWNGGAGFPMKLAPATRLAQGPAALKRGIFRLVPEIGVWYAVGAAPFPFSTEELVPESNRLNIYPNPTSRKLKIEGGTPGEWPYHVQDTRGRTVAKGVVDLSGGTAELSLPRQLSSGTYVLTIGNEQLSFLFQQ